MSTQPQGKWSIDTSTGREILMYENCSVIEAEQARYVLGLIEESRSEVPESVANALVEAISTPGNITYRSKGRYLIDHWKTSAKASHGDVAEPIGYVPPSAVEEIPLDGYLPVYAAPAEASQGGGMDDTKRLDWLRENYCDLRCIDVPVSADDSDVDWVVIEHYMDKPQERVIGHAYKDDPRAAIDAAMHSKEEMGNAN